MTSNQHSAKSAIGPSWPSFQFMYMNSILIVLQRFTTMVVYHYYIYQYGIEFARNIIISKLFFFLQKIIFNFWFFFNYFNYISLFLRTLVRGRFLIVYRFNDYLPEKNIQKYADIRFIVNNFFVKMGRLICKMATLDLLGEIKK